ncbi:MAG TPA: hypothetical protein VJ276_03495 [Thermoanaerobaculia bacterium]|nr:hypothetical protein [Thermoanaerobaculia bacterium]
MPIILPYPLSIQEIRVLQEFRRLAAETLPAATIKAIKHPVGGGEAPAQGLIDKGYLTASDSRDSFTLTEKARELLALDYKPEVESAGGDEEAVAD